LYTGFLKSVSLLNFENAGRPPWCSGVFISRSIASWPPKRKINANRENAQHSTGPKSETGKANSSQNNFRHGFCGKFVVLPSESQEEFDALLDNLRAEHKPQCTVEDMLILKMAQHFWLSQRAQMLSELAIDQQNAATNPDKVFAL
jgi:hypothetical protein